jgi:hypothetical protein
MYHGANNYLFIAGDTHYIDKEVLDAVMRKTFIDTKNVIFDIDAGKSFTWEIDELMKFNMLKVSLHYI